MKNQLVFFLLIFLGCSLGNNEKKSDDQMKEIEINNPSGQLVLKAQVVNNMLHGKCVWYSSDGKMVSNGTFNNGKPHDGSFLDWSLFFKGDSVPYDLESYCQDWVSMFESSFLSQRVDYSSVTVVYKDGEKVE